MNILDQFKLDGQTALVTGCKSGIGRAMAVGLAEGVTGMVVNYPVKVQAWALKGFRR